jgi:ribosomal protein S5
VSKEKKGVADMPLLRSIDLNSLRERHLDRITDSHLHLVPWSRARARSHHHQSIGRARAKATATPLTDPAHPRTPLRPLPYDLDPTFSLRQLEMQRARLEALEAARSALAALIARGGGSSATATATAATATAAAATARPTTAAASPWRRVTFATRSSRPAGAGRLAQDESEAFELARRALAATRLSGRGGGGAAAEAASSPSSSSTPSSLATTRVTFSGVRAPGDGGGSAGGGGGGDRGDRDRGGGASRERVVSGAVGVPPTFPILPPGVPDFFGASSNSPSTSSSSSSSSHQILELEDQAAARLADDSGVPDRDREDGSGGGADATEARLFLRERLERAALPPAVRRALFSDHWQELVYDVRRSVKVTTAGRLTTYKATVVVGNLDGLLGVGEARGAALQRVLLDAHLRAYERVAPVPRYRGHTIYHPVDATYHKARVRMWPRPAGAGLVASDALAALLELSGVRDVAAKASGRRKHKAHLLRAFLAAVGGQSLPHDGVEGSGVYVREVLYGAGSAGRGGGGGAGGRLPWKMARGQGGVPA